MGQTPVQEGSSFRGTQKFNPDGTINIHCHRCTRFICSVGEQQRIFSALCVFCQATDRGEVIDELKEKEIKLHRLPDGRQLPEILVSPPILPDPMGNDSETDIGKIGYFFKAISVLKAKAKALGKKNVDIESKRIAKLKRKKPVLEGGLMINLQVNEEEKK